MPNLIRSTDGLIAPQYLNEDGSAFEELKGANSGINVNFVGRLTGEPIRLTLVANTDTLFTFSAQCEKFDILNLGTVAIYVRVDAVAEVDGVTSILIPAGMGYELLIKGTIVHVISSSTSKVQIVGVR